MSRETTPKTAKLKPGTLEGLPKVELHLHLEGAIPLPALWELIGKYGGALKVADMEALKEKFLYRDFAHFIDTWQWKNGFLREYEDFTLIAGAVANDLADQNIRYVEAFYSPADFQQHGLEPQRLTEAIRAGLDEHKDRVQVKLIADLVRDFGPQRGMVVLREIAEVRDLGVIGIGIGGSEQQFPPEPYQNVYEEARRLGFRTTAHGGEAAGAESIWGAIRSLGVDRIGHGTRAVEDGALVAYLKEKQIPLEMCPLSNVRTGVVSRLEEHPIKEFYREGLMVFVNTDDPKMFNTSLAEEYEALVDALGFTQSDILNLIRNAIHSAWCNESTKEELLRGLNSPGVDVSQAPE
jgi:adenosine deaminase